jgi:hypothetical protein
MALDDNNTKVLLHFDGADASTTFTDESGKIWTPVGTAQLDTAQKKFGASSGLFDGNSDYISTPNHADLDFGNGDFTVDMWVRYNNLPVLGDWDALIGNFINPGAYSFQVWVYEDAGNMKVYWDTYGTLLVCSIDHIITIGVGVWTHFAFVRYGDIFTLYVNGIAIDTQTVAIGYTVPVTGIMRIGADNTGGVDGDWFDGWIDEVRISKGVARWTTDFTPPSSPYLPPTPPGTVPELRSIIVPETRPPATYELWLLDDAGRKMFLLDHYSYFSYTRSAHYLSPLQIGFMMKEWKALLGTTIFKPDWRIDVWRSPAYGYPMKREDTYMLRKLEVLTRQDGIEVVTLRGRNGMDLLNRRYAVQYEETAYTLKTDFIDDMMKAIVREQCLYGSCVDYAGVADNDRAFPQGEFTVEADASLGPSVTLAFPDRKLLDLIRELSDMSVAMNMEDSTNRKIFFGVVPVDLTGTTATLAEPAAQTGFQFRTYADRVGADRTGGVEFSVENENLKTPQYGESHYDEENVCYVKGKGERSARAVFEVENLSLISKSRWNRCESVKTANYENDPAGLESAGIASLGEKRPVFSLDCEFLNTPGSSNTPRSLYGIDWNVGDILPVNYGGRQFYVEVMSAYIAINEQGVENITGRNVESGSE